MHVEPRLDKFDPWRAPRGPGRKTKLKPWRTTEGNYDDGNYFKENAEWQLYTARIEMINKEMNNIDRPSPRGQAGRSLSSSVRTPRSTAQTKGDKEIPLQTIPTS